MNLWAVIPSCCRMGTLLPLVTQLLVDDINVVVIDTGYQPDQGLAEYVIHPRLTVIRDLQQPRNISRWWNTGLGYAMASELPGRDYVVAVLNDDVVIQPGFVTQLADGIITYPGAAAACPNVYGLPETLLVQSPHSGPRLPGYAFALAGWKRITADETLQWWYGDNDIDWQARAQGGVVHMAGVTIQHLYPDSTTTGELAEQAGRDRETFITKWGRAPW